jgi:uncharacterized protein (UPF0332 family)
MTARSIQPYELIGLAERLVPADAGTGRLRAVDLRRAVSTAYYALFHELINQAVSELIGTNSDGPPQRSQVSRWFAHTDVKTLAGAATGTGGKPAVAAALGTPSADLARVAEAFVALQDARHDADYDHDYEVERDEALLLIRTARTAIDAVQRLRKTGDPSFQRFLRLMLGAVKIAKVR